MKSYTYKGYTFRATSTTHANTMRPLYEIDGLKDRGTKPFLTTIAECKDFIREYVEAGQVWTSKGTLFNPDHK